MSRAIVKTSAMAPWEAAAALGAAPQSQVRLFSQLGTRRKASAIACLLFAPAILTAQKFYPDDPLEFEPPPRNVADLNDRKLSDYYDLLNHQFFRTGQPQPTKGPPIRARGVNTLGEPLQGAWWVKRHYYRRMSIEELKNGPGVRTVPSTRAKWTVVSAKNEGVTPGFVILDADKRRFFIKFDPLTNLEMATSADAITSRLFYAMGYYVPQNYVIQFTPEQLEIGPDVQFAGSTGKVRKMTRRDLTEILLKVPKTREGRYRATASLALEGKPIGPPRYYGTRTDDPNDIVPHEHRRDIRALHVIDAWVDHDDSRAINNYDAIVREGDRQFVRHHQLDFGSTLGSGTQRANSPRSGAYYFSWTASAKQLFTLGLVPPYWAFADYPDFPSLGRFEWKVFDPEKWVPEYHNPAFLNRLPDDEFWGAKLVTAFTDEEIRAIVSTGELSDKEAEKWLIECLIKRRNKIGQTYFAKVLPFDRFSIRNSELTWDDLGVMLGHAPRAEVDIHWERFDNATGARLPIAAALTARVPAPATGYAVAVLVSRKKPSQKVEVFVQQSGDQPRVVGVERYW